MIDNKENKILGISIIAETKTSILEKTLKYIDTPIGFFHIVSLNPENLVIAQNNEFFKKVLNEARIKIIDGVGIVIAGRWLNINIGERVTGVGMMEELMKVASDRRLRVLLIGGRPNLAESLAKCYQRQFPKAKYKGVYGIKNIKKPTKNEETVISSIVVGYKPHLVFVAFGSPDQELWIERHKKIFSGRVMMGVGGGLDYLSNSVRRPQVFIQKIGLEWLYRLFIQPWRWRRQLRLIEFTRLIIRQKWSKN
jgi:N-acetylglucosaminyldiphosphoundecaprenol N-acetyl-beta-D-mannosaminyltransferase